MEATQRDELSRWAEALADSDDDHAAAAGRAIQSLSAANAAGRAIDLREFRRTAKALGSGPAAELRSAGRAIRNLCEENAALDGKTSTARTPRTSRVGTFRLPWWRIAAAVAALAVLGGGGVLAARAAAPDLDATGPPPDALVGRDGLAALTFSVNATDAAWVLDGRPIQPAVRAGRHVYRPRKLADGRHTLIVTRPGGLFGSARREFTFTVDTVPPTLRLNGPAVVRRGSPLLIEGMLDPGSRLERDGASVAVAPNGRFALRVTPAPRNLVLRATDRAGNVSRWRVPVTVVPRRPKEPVRAVHVTAYAWADADLREGILELVRSRRVNAVQLDLKDESGEVGWASGVPLAQRIGAQLDIYDLSKAVKQLHGLGVRVIGRIVCFRDPIHAQAAWAAGRRAEVVQAPDGSRYSKYGGFTNFAHPAVRKYNIELAVAAAKLGVDEILYDYVRRPDGPLSTMVFPGLEGTPAATIVTFLAESRAALSKTDALVGASVFGVAATRPEEVAQDIPAMARHVDYIAPMLYPSHWGPGEYDVADPNGQPYDIVFRSTVDFVKQVRGTGARIVNWLQDFSYGRDYGAAEVQAQIRASRDAGVDEFILWDAAVTYTRDGLEPTAPVPALAESTEPPRNAAMPVRLPDPKPRRSGKPSASIPSRPRESSQPLPGLPPNELGRIPIVMHHMVRPDRVGEYDQTPAEFRAELDYLWRHGYTPVNVGELLAGDLDVPRGTTPVGFTFDDATTYQIAFTPGGVVKPTTAVGIMLDFARTHPGFVPKGTFYVNRTPFGSATWAKQALRWLTQNGFEIGNHTHGHVPLRSLSDDEVRAQLAAGEDLIQKLLPGYEVTSMSLPLGSLPRNEKLAVQGSWRGKRYGPYGVMLVGANPAPSPYSTAFDATAVPRIRTSHADWAGEVDFAFSYWMQELERDPGSRYVSDGDPRTITVPKGAAADVKRRFAGRVRVTPSR